MIIGVDGNEANTQKRVGIGEYAYQLLKEFSRIRGENTVFKTYLKDAPRNELPPASGVWSYDIIGPYRLWTQIALPLNLFTHFPRPNVFFTPSHYGPRFSPVPYAISVMDLSFLYFPELFAKHDLYQLINWTEYSVRRAAKVFTISQSSKNDILKEYKVKDENVIVTYPGLKKTVKEMEPIDAIRNKFKLPKTYVLFVGTIQPRKNIGKLIEAFARISNENKNVDLVIVGKKGWLYEPILQKPEELGISQRVHFLDFVSDEELATIYKHATCFVLPSLYEGFGLPVLEAMKYGCPVITSNISSLPEAGGDAALYVDPQDTDDIAKQMNLLITDSKLRKKLIEKGFKHIKKFSWENTAKQTLAVLEEVGSENT